MGLRLGCVGLLAWLAAPTPSSAQPAARVLRPGYAAALERYVSGDREGAVAAVAAMPERELREQVAALRYLRKQARACSSCADAVAWREAPLPAALMLHTDASLALARDRPSARIQESLAAAIASLFQDDPERAAVASRWFEVMAGLALADNRWADGQSWTERGLDAFPKSAELLAANGAIEEAYGAAASPRGSDEIAAPQARQVQANLARVRELREHLERARAVLRDALAELPALHEARLRLGRVAWRLGDADQARAELKRVLAESSRRETVFLAHLFLGRVDADAGRLDEAARSYEAALTLFPRCQSARIALSQLAWRRGDVAGARREVEAALRPAGERQQRDPFWQYPWGSGVGASERLEGLRREAVPVSREASP